MVLPFSGTTTAASIVGPLVELVALVFEQTRVSTLFVGNFFSRFVRFVSYPTHGDVALTFVRVVVWTVSMRSMDDKRTITSNGRNSGVRVISW